MRGTHSEIVRSRHARAQRVLAAVAPALTPLSWGYALGMAIVRGARLAAREVGGAAHVVAVGNLEVGGTGKTPLALALLEAAIARGLRAAYVSRGFRSRSERAALPTLVAPVGAGPLAVAGVRVVRRDHPDLAAEVGDEAAMVARRLPGVGIVTGRDKQRGVAIADAVLAAAVVVVDDAFQSWGLARDVDVVVLDGERPFDDGRLVPAGRLREEPQALARADIVLLRGGATTGAREAVRRVACARARVAVLEQATRWLDGDGRPVDAPCGEVVVVAGVARPDAVARAVARAAPRARAVLSMRFADHHRYGARDVRAIRRAAAGRTLVTTEKDWVKLRGAFDAGAVRVLRLDARVPRTVVDDALKPRREAAASALRSRRIDPGAVGT